MVRKIGIANVVLLAIIVSLLSSCTEYSDLQRTMRQIKSYTIGSEIKSNMGDVMLSVRTGNFIVGKKYVGDGNYGEDNWTVFESPETHIFHQELIYTGISSDTIYITYREYSSNMARPAFFLELKYDINISKLIVFRNYRLKILVADNEHISFKIIQD